MSPITKKGMDRLKTELEVLKKEFDAIPAIIGEAREKGDLKENAEYHSAKERQGMLNAMIGKLNMDINSCQVVDPQNLPADVVSFGKTVSLMNLDSKEKEVYTLVGNAESDSATKKISIQSQIARGLLNKTEGEEVVIAVPSGNKKYRIDKIEYMN